jgi:hypothetical protein
MDTRLVKKISNHVYRQFPEMEGKNPKVRLQTGAAGQTRPVKPTYLLTYNTRIGINGGKSISRTVRVVADTNGKIIKISTSR